MSLIKLAETGDLPSHQYMDQETLNWIQENRPTFPGNLDSVNIELLKRNLGKFTPKKEWFLLPRETDSIHGLRHIMRVSAYASLLSTTLQNDAAVIASSLHDLRRLDDKGDLGHAERAAKWFVENKDQVSQYYSTQLLKRKAEEIYFAIYFHEKPYSEISNNADYLKYKNTVDIVKTADALDRYRLPKLKWWINNELIKLIPPDNLRQFAYTLVLTSEQAFLTSKDSYESVINSLK